MRIPLSSIERDCSPQMRANGVDTERYWPSDGWHRIAACESLGIDAIEADVQPGGTTWPSSMRSRRMRHGLRRTQADCRRAIEAALANEAIRQMSDRSIAERCGVDHKTVAAVRRELSAVQLGLSNARRLGKDGKMRRTCRTQSGKFPISPEGKKRVVATPTPDPYIRMNERG